MSITRISTGISPTLSRGSNQIRNRASNLYSTISVGMNPTQPPYPDLFLAKTFHRRIAQGEGNCTVLATLSHRKIVSHYLHVVNGMQERGLLPLVHGQSAVWVIPQRILQGLGSKHSHLLRFPAAHSLKQREEIAQALDFQVQRRTTHCLSAAEHWLPFYNIITGLNLLDHHADLREHLLSVTIGLFHSERYESPLSLVFGGNVLPGGAVVSHMYPGNRSMLPNNQCQKISNQAIQTALEQRGLDSHLSRELITKIEPLYKEAEHATIGQLLVVGVPQHSLQRYVYHCKAGGMPTGIPIQKILSGLSNQIFPEQGCQARLLLCQETMNMESGIEVVNITAETAMQDSRTSTRNLSPVVEEILKILYSQRQVGTEELQRASASENRSLDQYRAIIEKIDESIKNS